MDNHGTGHAEVKSNSDSSSLVGPVILAAFGGALLLLIFALFGRKSREGATSKSTKTFQEDSTPADSGLTKSKSTASSVDSQRRAPGGQTQKSKAKDTYTHPLLVTTLRGHVGEICDGDFSASGKYLVTSSEGID